MSPHLRLERDGAVARVLIDRPERRNAFVQAMWKTLPRLVDEAAADPGVRVIVLQSARAGMFASGADIHEFAERSRDRSWRAANAEAIRASQTTLARAPIPTLAVVDGDCIGGGCGLAMACDMRLAAPTARFGITPARLGLVYPLHDTRLLVELVGPARARRMLFTGELLDAAAALRVGLVDEVAHDLPAAADALLAALVRASPSSQRATKAMIRRVLDGQLDDDEATMAVFDAAFTSEDFREGVAAFAQRRAPRFGA